MSTLDDLPCKPVNGIGDEPPAIAEGVDGRSKLHSISLALAATATLATTIAAYHFTIVRPALPRFAVIDVTELYRAKEAEFAKLLADPKATDADRVAAIGNAQRFAQDLQKLIETLPHECNCVVLNKAAVMSDSERLMTDLTPMARKAVGL